MQKPVLIQNTSWRDAPTVLTTDIGDVPWILPTIMPSSLHTVEVGNNQGSVIYGLALRDSLGRDVWLTQLGKRLTGFFDENIGATVFDFEPSPVTEWQGDEPPSVIDIGIVFTPIEPFSQLPEGEPSIEISYQFDESQVYETDPGYWYYEFRVMAAGQEVFPLIVPGDETPLAFS